VFDSTLGSQITVAPDNGLPSHSQFEGRSSLRTIGAHKPTESMRDPSLLLVSVGSKRGVGELFSATVAQIAANRTTVRFSKEEAISDEESFFRTWELV
jgi:hypothetical protein